VVRCVNSVDGAFATLVHLSYSSSVAFTLTVVEEAERIIEQLQHHDQRRYRKVVKCLALLSQDPTYPGLASHPYVTFKGPGGETVWESYVEQNTPAAWRLWWYYGPTKGEITVVDVGPHP